MRQATIGLYDDWHETCRRALDLLDDIDVDDQPNALPLLLLEVEALVVELDAAYAESEQAFREVANVEEQA